MDRQQTYMQTLSEVMNLLGMTKKELAEKAGVSRQTLYGWEKGSTSLKPNRTGRRVNSTLMRLLDEQIEETSHEQKQFERIAAHRARKCEQLKSQLSEQYRGITKEYLMRGLEGKSDED